MEATRPRPPGANNARHAARLSDCPLSGSWAESNLHRAAPPAEEAVVDREQRRSAVDDEGNATDGTDDQQAVEFTIDAKAVVIA